jgi:hypothetical protein
MVEGGRRDSEGKEEIVDRDWKGIYIDDGTPEVCHQHPHSP